MCPPAPGAWALPSDNSVMGFDANLQEGVPESPHGWAGHRGRGRGARPAGSPGSWGGPLGTEAPSDECGHPKGHGTLDLNYRWTRGPEEPGAEPPAGRG